MYRGAWNESETHENKMSVPLSSQEITRKRNVIFQHQSHKDRPVIPGGDERQFWLLAEESNRETAENYHHIGLLRNNEDFREMIF